MDFYLQISFSYSEKGECSLNSCAPFKVECLCDVSSNSRPKEHPSAWKRWFRFCDGEKVYSWILHVNFILIHTQQTRLQRTSLTPVPVYSSPPQSHFHCSTSNTCVKTCLYFVEVCSVSGLTAFIQTISGI